MYTWKSLPDSTIIAKSGKRYRLFYWNDKMLSALVVALSPGPQVLTYSDAELPSGIFINYYFKAMKLHIIAMLLLCSTSVVAQQRITISGFVTEDKSGERLPGVNVYIPGISYSAVTNNYGFYSLTIPVSDSAVVSFSFVGYESVDRNIRPKTSMELNVFLTSVNQLKEVVIKATRDNDISQRAQMSQIELPIGQIKKIPALFGEKDVIKVLQLMPGVQKGTEGQTGLYVRGGGPDQNLIILDDAVVYNANHLFGFFSVFNSDAIRSVELTKGGFPARYGGRLSSVVEMTMKEGSKDRLHCEGGIGLISSRLTLEGPIKKDGGLTWM
jgi:hypothetical protein